MATTAGRIISAIWWPITVPAAQLLPVPDGLSLRDAALSYLPSWSVSGLHLGRYAAAETVVVTGLGLVGASAALGSHRPAEAFLGAEVQRLDLVAVLKSRE